MSEPNLQERLAMARRHHWTAWQNLSAAESAQQTIWARLPPDPPELPGPVERAANGKVSARQVADHSTRVARHSQAVAEYANHVAQAAAAVFEFTGSLMTAMLAQQRCLDELTIAVTEDAGFGLDLLQDAVRQEMAEPTEQAPASAAE